LTALLQGGVAVCLPDLRGTGETRPAGDRRGPPAGRLVTVQETSAGTVLACEELMLGQTLLGARLRDLRVVIRYLRSRADLDGARIALWGDSLAPVNAADSKLAVPWDAEKLPHQAEPLGPLLALLGGLWEDDIRAVALNGGLASYRSLLESQFCFVPHDVVVPGVLAVSDLADVAAALAPRPLRLSNLVDGHNRRVAAKDLAVIFAVTQAAYQNAKAAERLRLDEDERPGIAAWLLTRLQAK
jgi:hypothetical protein